MRQAIALAISIALGLLAVFAMKNYINREKESNHQTIEMVEVLFSKRHMSSGTKLNKADILIKKLPKDSVSTDMVKPHELIEVTGQLFRREINRGGPLFHSDFLSEQIKTISTIAIGRRLVSIPVNQISGVAGLIKPGNRVDVFLTFSSSKRDNSSSSKTILLLENITVHATDSQTVNLPERFGSKKRRGYSSLTLSVTSVESAILTNAVGLGSINFVLRSKDDFKRIQNNLQIDSSNIESMAKEANELRWKSLRGRK